MAKRFLTPIDLTKLELRNAAIQNLATPPENPSTGQIYFDTQVSKLQIYDGENWIEVGNSEEEIEDIVANLVVAGDGINKSYNSEASTLTIANTGVLSLTGTTDEVSVSASAGDITIGLPATINANTSGNAATATALETPRAISISGGVSGSASFDGSENIDISVLLDSESFVSSLTGTENEISVSASVGAVTIGLPTSVTIQEDLTVLGDLTVSGSVTYLDTDHLRVADNIITLNYGASGSPVLDSGIEIDRGDSLDVSLIWNEENDIWTLTNDGTSFHSIARKYAVNVGNDEGVSFEITHNLGTQDVVVSVYDNAILDTVEAGILISSANTVNVSFAVAPGNNAYRVVIVG